MKFYLYFLLFILTFGIFQACVRDSEFSNSKPEFVLDSVKFNQPSERPTGAILLDKKVYEALPQVDVRLLKPFEGFEMKSRASSRYLSTPPVKDQGTEGSCTAFAVGYCLGSYYNKGTAFGYSNNKILSPEYLYNRTKVSSNCKDGAVTYNVLNHVAKKGCTNISLMPYSDKNGCSSIYPPGYGNPKNPQSFYIPLLYISPTIVTVAKKENDVKSAINKGYPVVMTFNVDANFDNQTAASPFIYKSVGGSVRSSHAVVIIGYNDATKLFKVQNSWGVNEHDKGYFYLPYSMLTNMKELYISQK